MAPWRAGRPGDAATAELTEIGLRVQERLITGHISLEVPLL